MGERVSYFKRSITKFFSACALGTIKSRKEANLKNKELQSLTGKNTKLMSGALIILKNLGDE